MKNTIVEFRSSGDAPEGGNGDVYSGVGTGDEEVYLRWKDGKVVDVVSKGNKIYSNSMSNAEMLTDGTDTAGVVTCQKCATDSTTGNKICWDVPC
jgi:hypothetical protein